jgi:hypothetical protein
MRVVSQNGNQITLEFASVIEALLWHRVIADLHDVLHAQLESYSQQDQLQQVAQGGQQSGGGSGSQGGGGIIH